MKVAVFQFSAESDLTKNHEKIVNAIAEASKNQVRLLVFQECAACGYPPIEREDIVNINSEVLDNYLKVIIQLSAEHNMYIALGTITKRNEKYYNSIQIISPHVGIAGTYDKRALWGWDTENFNRGEDSGIFDIDDIKIGFRICFEVRFPEYFRELYKAGVKLCFVSFNDVSDEDNLERYELLKSHLRTRAVENVMSVISVNSTSKYQTAPTSVIDHNGAIILVADRDKECLIIYDYTQPEISFGMKGRIVNNDILQND